MKSRILPRYSAVHDASFYPDGQIVTADEDANSRGPDHGGAMLKRDSYDAFPHWCQDGHPRIGFSGDAEPCPVCAVLWQLTTLTEEHARLLGFFGDASPKSKKIWDEHNVEHAALKEENARLKAEREAEQRRAFEAGRESERHQPGLPLNEAFAAHLAREQETR